MIFTGSYKKRKSADFGSRNFFWKKLWVRKSFDLKKKVKKILFKKISGLTKIVGLQNFAFKGNLSSKFFLGPIKLLVLKKFCPRTFWSTKIMTPKKFGPKSLVKIGPVTAETLLIWTNVTRAYLAWLDKCHNNSWHFLNMVQRSYL